MVQFYYSIPDVKLVTITFYQPTPFMGGVSFDSVLLNMRGVMYLGALKASKTTQLGLQVRVGVADAETGMFNQTLMYPWQSHLIAMWALRLCHLMPLLSVPLYEGRIG